MTRFILLILLSGASTLLPAQDLFMHRNIRKAYDRGTRSEDGRPGPAYWQNRAEYTIQAEVDLPARTISGTAGIRYFNNSPDTLRMLRLKLAHDLWRKNAVRAYELAASDITDGVEIREVSVRGKALPKDKMNQANTFLDLSLDEPLLPGASIDLSVDWSHIAPAAKGAPRVCVCDSTTWFNAYWYPQVAVYDDLHGWADMPYNGMQEMYNDFSDYDVRITVPGTVMVWATGILENAGDLLRPEYLKRYQQALKSKEVVKIFAPEDYKSKKGFFQKADRHTFHYKAQGVPDFAFGFSDHYLWDACAALVDPASGREALVSAAYDPESQDYYEVCRIAADGLQLMSTWLPGYPYPYPRMTVFNGDDGMEFPMMCNDASTHPRSPASLTVHETSHTWFPFMMGINEQYYAWMDEGWASFFDLLVTDSLMGRTDSRLRGYDRVAGTDVDMPPMVPSRQLGNPSYRIASYNRPQAAYMTLYQMLGYERFHACMVEYMNRWKGKHPQPFDFFNTWNDAAGENLDWFWKSWFFDWGYPDIAINSVKQKGDMWEFVVENKGTLPVTVHGVIDYDDGSQETFRYGANAWKAGNKTLILSRFQSQKSIVKISLGHPLVPDSDMTNNVWNGSK